MTWPANKILRALAALAGEATTLQISETTGLTVEQVWDACDTLVKNKLAVRHGRGVYQLTPAGKAAFADGKEIKGGPKSPTGPKIYRGTFRDRLWQAIRKERKGTIGGFLSIVLQEGENEAKALVNAQKYISFLCRAGYMQRLPGKQQGTALTSNGFNRYILIVNNGPKAPVVCGRQTRLLDPNTGAIIELKEAQP
jgi:hypothetical protein